MAKFIGWVLILLIFAAIGIGITVFIIWSLNDIYHSTAL